MPLARVRSLVAAALFFALPLSGLLAAHQRPVTNQSQQHGWTFAVSGDSRNCGDIAMPAIAASALKHDPRFYWHLGDLRKTYDFDEDMLHQPEHVARPMTIRDYMNIEWPYFIDNQIAAWGQVPVYVGIGNHETIAPKTRQDFILQFADWLDSPTLQRQRLADNPKDHTLRAYYHWVEGPVDFIYLDNATNDQFDAAQMTWLTSVLQRDRKDPAIKSIVLGMHKALPDSISYGHSMNESAEGTQSGRLVYRQLLDLQDNFKKHVYVLASHSHFLMEGIYNTEHWRSNGGVIPGWIVGTAGAVRYALPPAAKDAKQAKTNVYGYLLGKVEADDSVTFTFEEVKEADVPSPIVARYKSEFVHWCFAENHQ